MQVEKLEDICEIASGGTPKRSEDSYWKNGKIPWLKISDIKSKYVDKSEEHITQKGLDNSSAKLFKKGTIIYTIFATVGEVAILNIDATTNQAIAGLTIKDSAQINPSYLFYFLKSIKKQMHLLSRGVAQNNINLSVLRQIKVPIPDLNVQERIVNALDQMQNNIKLRQMELSKLDILIKARFVEMFEREINIVKIEDVCSKIVDCPHSTPKYKGKLEYPCIRTSEIKDGFIDWGTMKYVSREECSIRNKRIVPESGDIVYAREGNYGNAVVLPEGHQFCLGQRTMLFRPDYKKCNSQFLLFSLLSNFVKKQADVNNNSSTVPHVNVKDAKKFKIKLPEIDKQNEFASFVKQVDKSKVVNASIMKYIISIRFYLYFKENKEGAR